MRKNSEKLSRSSILIDALWACLIDVPWAHRLRVLIDGLVILMDREYSRIQVCLAPIRFPCSRVAVVDA
jgi:hypothetical protein